LPVAIENNINSQVSLKKYHTKNSDHDEERFDEFNNTNCSVNQCPYDGSVFVKFLGRTILDTT